jgi:hypothetical protein
MGLLKSLIVGPGIGGDPSSDTNTLLHPLGALYDSVSGNKTDRANAAVEEEKKAKAKAIQDAYNNRASTGLSLKKGGKVSSASKRADGIAVRGKTRA